GERTLLIDADMRGTRQHQLFRIPNQYGLSSLLTGRVNGWAAERIRHFSDLSVIPAGATPPNPLELVSRPEFRDLLANEAQRFDVVLIDTPAAASSSDAQAIAARAGGALVLGREDRSRVEEPAGLVASLQSTHAEADGCLLNRF